MARQACAGGIASTDERIRIAAGGIARNGEYSSSDSTAPDRSFRSGAVEWWPNRVL